MNNIKKLLERVLEIYANGIYGMRPQIPIEPEELRQCALQKLNKNKRNYLEGSAGVGQTFQSNISEFQRYQILPRVGNAIDQISTEKEILGFAIPVPIMICPMGGLGLYHSEAEAAVAKAANALSIPMMLSELSTVPLEKIAGIVQSAPKLMQLYLTTSKEINQSIIERAVQSGFNALVITMDTKVLGWRPSDLAHAYSPYLIDGVGLGQFYRDPAFQKLLAMKGSNSPDKKVKINYYLLRSIFRIAKHHPDGFFKALTSGEVVNTLKHLENIKFDSRLNWLQVREIVESTKLPVFVKGILHPDDAKQAMAMGVKGIIVSNHGGRQCDALVSSLQMLPEIVKVIDKQILVLFDSGIRSGVDILKALALGADAVCIGRPIIYGLTLQGERGVINVLENMISEFLITMALSGITDINQLDDSILRKK